MPGPARRRVDLTRLPAPARYALALAVVAAVVAVALTAPGHHRATADWYTIVVRIGAVLLLLYLGFRLIAHALKTRRRRR